MLGWNPSVCLRFPCHPCYCCPSAGQRCLAPPSWVLRGAETPPSLGREKRPGAGVALAWHSPHALAPLC